jgi:hypothetical protein
MFPVIPAGLLVSRLQRIGGDDWEPPALRGACIGLAAAQGQGVWLAGLFLDGGCGFDEFH